MNTVISLRLDSDVKTSAQEVAKSAGLTLSALVNSYLKQVAVTRRIELYAPEPMTPQLEKLIAEVEQELAQRKPGQGFKNSKDFLAALKK